MYTLHHIDTRGVIVSKERLGKHEIEAFVESVYGKWSNIHMTNDATQETRVFVDNGEAWERVI